MSYSSCPRIKRIIFVLPLLLVLAFFLVGCGSGNSANSTSGNGAGQTTTTSQNGPSSSDGTNVQNGDQQAQNILQSLDKANQDADNANNSGGQDTSQNP